MKMWGFNFLLYKIDIWQGARSGDQGDVGRWPNRSCPEQTSMHCPVPFMASDDFCKKNECKISFPRQDIAQIWWHLNSTFKNCFSPFMRRYLTSKLNEIDKLGVKKYTRDSGESISDNLFIICWTVKP